MEAEKIDIVTLNTGVEVPKPLLITTLLAINGLLNTDTIAFYDLVMMCRDGSPAFGPNAALLVDRNLCDRPNHPHSTVRDIVLAAVKGDGLQMRIISTNQIVKQAVTP